jgi:hypothetical protein
MTDTTPYEKCDVADEVCHAVCGQERADEYSGPWGLTAEWSPCYSKVCVVIAGTRAVRALDDIDGRPARPARAAGQMAAGNGQPATGACRDSNVRAR